MKILQSTVALDGRTERAATTRVQERLQMSGGERRPEALRPSAVLHLSPQAARARPETVPGHAVGRPAHGDRASADPVDDTRSTEAADDGLDPRMRTLARMIETLTGLPVRVFRAEALQAATPAVDASVLAGSAETASAPVGWGLVYDRVEIRTQSQTVTFQASGRVVLADGRSVDVALGFSLQSTSVDVHTLSVRAGDAVQRLKDPLVLSLDGGAPSLSEGRFAFDVDADGQTDRIAFAGSGSGFLVLDRNGNGAIDDGRELFGALSGDGFADLAALDADGNGWIDEADPAHAQLQVWTRDSIEAPDRLQTLAEAGVGALHLGRVGTPFALGDAGALRSSGLYLTEAGEARPLQQIDLAV